MCVFCKIINGEIPCFKIYENESVLAFLDISQSTIGHTLVVPKKHVENVFSLSEEDSIEIMKAVTNVSKKLKKALNLESVNLLNNSGFLAGQTVMHFHMHIIPRYENDTFKIVQDANEPDFAALKELCDKINK